jgi:hypothetical protein
MFHKGATAPAYVCGEACDIMLAVSLAYAPPLSFSLYSIAHSVKGNIMFLHIFIFTLRVASGKTKDSGLLDQMVAVIFRI